MICPPPIIPKVCVLQKHVSCKYPMVLKEMYVAKIIFLNNLFFMRYYGDITFFKLSVYIFVSNYERSVDFL